MISRPGVTTAARAGFKGWHVDHSSPLPLYHQIAELLRDWVRGVEEATRLPSEAELVSQLGVSRATVRKAVEILEAEGLIYRKRGSGTFAAPHKVPRQLRLTSLFADLVSSGREVRTELLDRKYEPANAVVAEKLGVNAGDIVVELERLRFVDSQPFGLMKNWLPADLGPEVMRVEFDCRSLYDVLQNDCGIDFARGLQSISARQPTSEEASILEIPPNEPLIRMTRQTYSVSNRVVEWAEHLYAAHLTEFISVLEQ